MARINLLPWRAERRKQRQKEFGLMLGAAAAGAILVSFLIIMFYSGQIGGQTERNQYLQAQIDEVKQANSEIQALEGKKAKLLARKEIIEKLQSDRATMVHLFDSLVRTIPDGVMLTAIKQDDQILALDGRAQSNARVSTYLRNLESAGWLTSPELAKIEAQGTDKGLPYVFNLKVRLANPNAPVDSDGDGVPDAPALPAATVVDPNAPLDTLPAAPLPMAPAISPPPATEPAAVAAPAATGTTPAPPPVTTAPAASPAPAQEGAPR